MDLRPQNNEELIAKIKQRNIREFERLYNATMPTLHRFAFRYTYDSEVAKDLVHDAFAWIWNNPDKITQSGNIRALLYNLVKSNCLNHLRALDIHDRNSVKLLEATSLSLLVDDDGHDDASRALSYRLSSAMALLPEKGRLALELHIVGNMRVKAIAEEMNVAESTVKTHLKRAMKVLRESMLLLWL